MTIIWKTIVKLLEDKEGKFSRVNLCIFGFEDILMYSRNFIEDPPIRN